MKDEPEPTESETQAKLLEELARANDLKRAELNRGGMEEARRKTAEIRRKYG